jgi:hypothetical protein
MTDAFAPAIAALQSELADIERKARELKSTINVLCKHAGTPELYPNLQTEGSGPTVTAIRADTFYGKVINTAAREYLEMRKTAGLGPATPREIYDALVAGGFQFEAKNDQVALVGLRSNLRKNSKTFHKLPNGQYGLLSWYPNAKPSKSSDADDDANGDTKSAASAKPTADNVSSEAPANHDEGGASEPPAEED